MNTITIEFCKEDRKLLEDLMSSVARLTSVIGGALPKETQKEIIEGKAEVSVGLPVEGAAHLEPVTVEEEAPAPAPIVISLAEFQKAVTLAVSKGAEAKKTVKEIINKYATSVSGVPEDKRAEVIAELSNI